LTACGNAAASVCLSFLATVFTKARSSASVGSEYSLTADVGVAYVSVVAISAADVAADVAAADVAADADAAAAAA
jgi:hypothetical protein